MYLNCPRCKSCAVEMTETMSEDFTCLTCDLIWTQEGVEVCSVCHSLVTRYLIRPHDARIVCPDCHRAYAIRDTEEELRRYMTRQGR